MGATPIVGLGYSGATACTIARGLNAVYLGLFVL